MMKPAVTLASLLFLAATASADTVTTQADTLVVVTPNAPVIGQQGEPQSVAQPLMPPGAAEMPPPPPSQPMVVANNAPQNEDWNNVSHINGVPVKVGERGDYLYRFRKNNIQFNPFGLFFGLYDLSASHALSQNLAISAAITGTDEFFQFSATLPLYFRRTFSGPFLEPGLLVRTEQHDYYADCYDCSYSSTGSMSTSWTGPQLMLGWHWTFDSGLNLSAAFGVAKKLNSDDNDYYDDNTEANGYFRVGYAF